MRMLALLLSAFFLFVQPHFVVAEEAKQTTSTEAKKPKRELSEKQKRNVAIMRACGAEWRAAKAEGKVKGQKWRQYLKECRKRHV